MVANNKEKRENEKERKQEPGKNQTLKTKKGKKKKGHKKKKKKEILEHKLSHGLYRLISNKTICCVWYLVDKIYSEPENAPRETIKELKKASR